MLKSTFYKFMTQDIMHGTKSTLLEKKTVHHEYKTSK